MPASGPLSITPEWMRDILSTSDSRSPSLIFPTYAPKVPKVPKVARAVELDKGVRVPLRYRANMRSLVLSRTTGLLSVLVVRITAISGRRMSGVHSHQGS